MKRFDLYTEEEERMGEPEHGEELLGLGEEELLRLWEEELLRLGEKELLRCGEKQLLRFGGGAAVT